MKQYDQQYFDHWYRDPEHRVGSRATLTRLVGLAVALAEQILQRPLRTVLDIGAGEGRWQPVLARMRPHARYQGVEPSSWAVEHWGKRRNVVQGDFDSLHQLGIGGPFDLVVVADVLHYLDSAKLGRALDAIAPLVDGIAFCPTFTGRDEIIGDREDFHSRSGARYRAAFGEAGMVQMGPWAWVPRDLASELADLERC